MCKEDMFCFHRQRGVKPTDLKDGCVSSLRTFTSTGHPIILPDNDWGVQSPPNRNVFRFMFHNHSQARISQVIGSLGKGEVPSSGTYHELILLMEKHQEGQSS